MLLLYKKYLHKIVFNFSVHVNGHPRLCIKEGGKRTPPQESGERKRKEENPGLEYGTSVTGKYVHVKIQQNKTIAWNN